MAELLPGGKHNIEMLLTHDVIPYKKRKVRVLNGSHTNLVAAGLLLGMDTVYDCMQDSAISSFVRDTLQEEIVPHVPGSAQFAEDVLERFANPYLNHQLTSIALNSISKWRARVLPSFKDCYAAAGQIPSHLTIGFSYLMALYAAVRREDGKYYSGKIQMLDDQPYLDHFADGGSVTDFMKKEEVWGEDLTAYDGFAEAVCTNVEAILRGEKLL